MDKARRTNGRDDKGKIPLANPRRRWKDNMRMDLRKTECEGVDWMHLSQDSDQ
jgi:hypothetical protein